MSDEPPILSVGTAVSAKYKGAFCEAKVSRVFPQIRYRVSYKEPNMGTDTLKEEHIKATGAIRVGKTILAWHHGSKKFTEAQVMRIQDQSQYTVVFDDGDITTLRRNYLCLKSGRHFNESETLDQLPLTHPEHFGNPVVGGRSRRRNRNRGEDSDGEHEEADPEMEGYASDVGRVVMGENFEKKRNKDWPPGLIMLPKNSKMLNTKEEYLIRSFRDDRFYNVPKKDVTEFNKEMGERLEKSNTPFYSGVQKALKYLNTGDLPANWEKHSLSHSDRTETDTELNFSDSSDDEPCEEKDRFVAQLYKFLDEAGTPLNKTPTIGGEDVDLYRLFSVVNKLGGYNKVSNHNKWKTVTGRLKFGNSQSVMNQVKQVYKKCLLSFETFYKTLGVTMLNHNKSSKKSNKGRSLIRDKDRATPINSPKPLEKDEEVPEKKEEKEEKTPTVTTPAVVPEDKTKKRNSDSVVKKKETPPVDISESSSSDVPEASTSVGRPKRSMEKLKKTPTTPKATTPSAPSVVEKTEEGQQTRSKSLQQAAKQPEPKKAEPKVKEVKQPPPVKLRKTEEIPSTSTSKRALKRSQSESVIETPQVNIGDKLKVYYGPSIESKITYEAKVVEIEKDGNEPVYLVHYTGWNTRYDEWIRSDRIAENLSATNKAAKKLKQFAAASSNKALTPATKVTAAKRKRNVSVTGRGGSANEISRSTTPLSSTSNSSRPKTPATPATRSSTRSARREQKRTRRTSVQTDTSLHTDTESAGSESESETSIKTRSGSKNEENEQRNVKKRMSRLPLLSKSKVSKLKDDDDDDTEKDEEPPVSNERVKRTRKVKKMPDKSPDEEESDDETSAVINLPNKGRDFDLNQIRSELKGFSKGVSAKILDGADKDTSSDDSTKPIKLHITAEEEDEEEVEFNETTRTETVEKTIQNAEKSVEIEKETAPSSSCDDIYEFKEPEPFEFENRPTLNEDKSKKRLPRFYDDSAAKTSRKSPAKCTPSDVVVAPSVPVVEVDKKPAVMPAPTPKPNEIEEDDDVKMKKEKDDPFDKLVESPSFNIVKVIENKAATAVKPAPIREPSEETDDCSHDMELSDTESQTQPIFVTTRPEEVFTDTSSELKTNTTSFVLEFPKLESKSMDCEDEIKASIQRVIEQTASSSTDDDTGDTLLNVTLPVSSNYQKIPETKVKTPEKSSDVQKSPFSSFLKELSPKEENTETEVKEELEKKPVEIHVETKIEQVVTNQSEKKEANSVPTTVFGQAKEEEPTTSVKDEPKKRKKVISRPFIESDSSDSSDSDNLVIAKSDEDENSMTVNDEDKTRVKEDWYQETNVTDDEKRNFAFENSENVKKDEDDKSMMTIDDQMEIEEDEEEEEEIKEDEPDSMLLCEETIPRSPAPPNEPAVEEHTRRSKSALEMPFASVPGSSNNNKSIFFNNSDPVRLRQSDEMGGPRDTSGLLTNTPPSTPESTLSNLSPREDHGNLSPDSQEIDAACNQRDYHHQMKRSKMCLFSDEDSRMACDSLATKKEPGSSNNVGVKKRRGSYRTNDPSPPAKRGRKSAAVNMRSRHNSDSDEDISDHSLASACNSRNGESIPAASYSTFGAERPLKYDFRANLEGMSDSNQRINHILTKMADLRKVYMDVKVELANIERRRKKIKRRQREALKTMKQVVSCA